MDNKTWRMCAYCGQEDVFLWNQSRRKDGSKIYVNEEGARWAGRRCPKCERSRVNSSVRCTPFELDTIRNHLSSQGYRIHTKSVPMIVEKDNIRQTVGIRRVKVENGQLVFDEHDLRPADFYVLLFAEVRLCNQEKLDRMMVKKPKNHHSTESFEVCRTS